MAELELQHLTKVFGKHRNAVRAVDELDLSISSAEILALVGPSGCGKTTTLRLVAGLDVPDNGTVILGGRDVTKAPPKDRDVAMVFQNYALYPHMSVFDNMAFGLKVRGVEKKEIKLRVAPVASKLGIADLLQRKPRELSGGQQQRVALGRAIVRKPRAFLLDEPLSNLDASLRADMRAELRGLLAELGTTAIYVTHDQEEAMSLGDRIGVMNRGKVVQVGDPETVYNDPVDSFVAGFVGRPRMNFFCGHLIARDGREFVATADGDFEVPDGFQSDRAKGEIAVGIRPEAFRLDTAGRIGPRVKVEVKMIERLGSHRDVHAVTRGGRRIVARLDGEHDIKECQTVEFVVDQGKMMFFEAAEFGKNLMHSSAGTNN